MKEEEKQAQQLNEENELMENEIGKLKDMIKDALLKREKNRSSGSSTHRCR